MVNHISNRFNKTHEEPKYEKKTKPDGELLHADINASLEEFLRQDRIAKFNREKNKKLCNLTQCDNLKL